MTDTPPAQRRVEVRVRARPPACVIDAIEETVTRLERLEDAGTIADLEVTTWSPCRLDAIERIGDGAPLERFRTWARSNGYTLAPAFGRRTVESMVDSESHTELVVPIVTVAVHDGDDLECVAPCGAGTDVYTVPACVDALEEAATDLLPASFGRDRPSEADDTSVARPGSRGSIGL